MRMRKKILRNVWSKLFLKRDEKKMAKFASQIEADYGAFFEPNMQGGDVKCDSITGEEFLPGEKIREVDGLSLKSATCEQIEIGKKLRETNLLVIKEGDPLSYWSNKVHVTPANLGFTYYFFEQ